MLVWHTAHLPRVSAKAPCILGWLFSKHQSRSVSGNAAQTRPTRRLNSATKAVQMPNEAAESAAKPQVAENEHLPIAEDMLRYINSSATQFHAVGESRRCRTRKCNLVLVNLPSVAAHVWHSAKSSGPKHMQFRQAAAGQQFLSLMVDSAKDIWAD